MRLAGSQGRQLCFAIINRRRTFRGQLVTQFSLEQPHPHRGVVARQAHAGVFRNYDPGAIHQHQECRLRERFDRVATDNRP